MERWALGLRPAVSCRLRARLRRWYRAVGGAGLRSGSGADEYGAGDGEGGAVGSIAGDEAVCDLFGEKLALVLVVEGHAEVGRAPLVGQHGFEVGEVEHA